jgi:hypothetical protein
MEYHLRTWLLFISSPPRLAAEFGRSPKRDTNQFDQEKKRDTHQRGAVLEAFLHKTIVHVTLFWSLDYAVVCLTSRPM